MKVRITVQVGNETATFETVAHLDDQAQLDYLGDRDETIGRDVRSLVSDIIADMARRIA